MQVYKFGGASIKNVAAFRRTINIISEAKWPLVIVVSAMGKTTNKLEEILSRIPQNDKAYIVLINELEDEHLSLMAELIDPNHPVFQEVKDLFRKMKEECFNLRESDFDFAYDQIVSYGELLSSKILSACLHSAGVSNRWIDIRQVFITDNNFRDAGVLYDISATNCQQAFSIDPFGIYVTQGFIAANQAGETTTLGREGSDYSAALLASFLDARALTLWKDVKGIYNVDPAKSEEALLVSELSYLEMMELAFYGAKVIHPKALKPLELKNIPILVKSFVEANAPGTRVSAAGKSSKTIPYIIFKEEQVLISVSIHGLSFIAEEHISRLFALLSDFRLSVNLMQHAAISFSVCVDRPRGQEVEQLISILSQEYKVLYNDNVQLITIQNYVQTNSSEWLKGRQILLEQRSRQTLQVVVA